MSEPIFLTRGTLDDDHLRAVARLLACAVDQADLPGNGGTTCEAPNCCELGTEPCEQDGGLRHFCRKHASTLPPYL